MEQACTRRRALVGLIASAFLAASAGDAAAQQVPRVLTLEDALDLALHHSPRIAAAGARARSAGGRARDAARPLNPTLAASVENWGGSLGKDHVESTLEVAQTIELGGDRGARSGLANAEERAAVAERSVEERRALAAVAEDFLNAWLAQERIRAHRDAIRLGSDAVSAAAERLRIGAGSPVEPLRAEGDLALREIELREGETELAAARRALALHWGASEATFDSLALGAPDLTPPQPLEALQARLTAHPERTRIAADVAAADARVRESRAARVPNLDVRLGIRRLSEFEESGLVGGIALPLPIWNAQGGAVTAAEAERELANARRIGIERSLEVELAKRHERLLAASEVFAIIRDRVLPSTDDALARVQAVYRSGRVSYLELLEGQRASRSTRLRFLEAARDVWSARLALDRFVAPAATPGEQRGER